LRCFNALSDCTNLWLPEWALTAVGDSGGAADLLMTKLPAILS